MVEANDQFCVRQFKPAIAVIIVLAIGTIGWTWHEAKSSREGFSGMASDALQQVATAPRIRAGTPAPHPDWGTCANCHTVTGGAPARTVGAMMQVATAAPIRAGTPAPHPDWGNCANCHTITGNSIIRPAAATIPTASVVPQIGAWLQPLTQANADRLGLDNPHGVLVTGVTDPSPATRGGLQVGDVIRRIDNRQIETLNDALAMIGDKEPRSTIKLLVLRGGRERKIFLDISSSSVERPVVVQGKNGQVPERRASIGAEQQGLAQAKGIKVG